MQQLEELRALASQCFFQAAMTQHRATASMLVEMGRRYAREAEARMGEQQSAPKSRSAEASRG